MSYPECINNSFHGGSNACSYLCYSLPYLPHSGVVCRSVARFLELGDPAEIRDRREGIRSTRVIFIYKIVKQVVQQNPVMEGRVLLWFLVGGPASLCGY